MQVKPKKGRAKWKPPLTGWTMCKVGVVMSPILDRIVWTDCGAWKCTSMVIWPKDKRVIAW
ncbi:hypothetical protein F2Q69_00031511 [Brassica cretica]|uniref:Uncharacterized protein n=1 Tax=Brassica cretica TaxID=69181 RepID=A0A8S9S6J5_BRACR|nr:hypothetical protein F2Q69_00031511 [Brassica cretica]